MLKVEALRDELVKVSKVGFHKKVAAESGISVGYLDQIKNGKNAKTEKEENRTLLRLLILNYRRIGRNKIYELEEALK